MSSLPITPFNSMIRLLRRSTPALAALIAGLLFAPATRAQQAPPGVGEYPPQPLPFTQDWSNTGLISANNEWAAVPGIFGYRGDELTTATGTDPQLITADGAATPLWVSANQTAPNTFTTGGPAEFEIADPVVALTGSGTADAPHIVLRLNLSGEFDIRFRCNLRDIDGSTDNAIQPIAFQYRVGSSGPYTNIPAGFVADASTGPSLATLVTPVDFMLPDAVENAADPVFIRIITTNAVGNDEWIGIDDIEITTSVTVTQQLGENAGAGNDAGWRMLSAPVEGLTVGSLVLQNLVQGIPGEYPAAGSNIRTDYDGTGTTTGFLSPSGDGAALEPGKGFIWYLYDLTFDPDPGNTTGQSESYELPLPLSATGAALSGLYTTTPFASRAPGADGFYLIGNPFAQSLDLNGISVSAGVLQNSFSIYDPAISNYVIRTANGADDDAAFQGIDPTADDVAVWQGFFGQVTAPVGERGGLTVTYDGAYQRGTTPPFYGRGAAAATSAGVAQDVHLTLTGALASGATTTDVAAYVRFNDAAVIGWDAYDFSKQMPPATSYALVAPVGADWNGGVGKKAVESRPTLVGSTSVPVAFTASEAGTFTLAADLETVPEAWTVQLTDAVTGGTADLRAGAYVFTAEAGAWTERFTITVASATTANEGGDAAFRLTEVAPNPAAGRASLSLTTPSAERVTAEVFDALGRRVATVFDGQVSAGASTALVVETGALAPGAYVVRVAGETFTESRRLTVVR